MSRLFRPPLAGLALAATALAAAGPALAAPVIRVPFGARFLTGQKFDIRVETAAGVPTLTIDGRAQAFTSNTGGGYNVRAYFNSTAGVHTLTATDGTGSASAQFEIINPNGGRRPSRNIIILLGDGMGVQHRTAARIVRYGLTAGHPNGALAMDTMPGIGLVATASLNAIVTDSAPGMSNYVTGNKANNNQEGVLPDNTADAFDNPRMEYLSEYLHRVQGKSLGIVSTADIEDATPAANAVHTSNRGAGTGICDQYLDESRRTGLTVLLGGGRRWFLPAGQFGSSRGNSTDYTLGAEEATAYGLTAGAPGSNPGALDPARDLIGDFQAQGFAYASDRASLASVAPGATKLLGLFGYGNMNVAYDKIAKRRGEQPGRGQAFVVDDYYAPDQPLLDEMADSALGVLNKNPSGFVLMIEGAHIDKQSHAMDADRAIWETIEFDNAVRKCLDFANRVGNTTVIVTADHECSGFSIIGALSGPTGNAGSIANLRSLPSDTGTLDPATQPNRQRVVGTYDAAGFPSYTILGDGFPSSADIDGKLLIGFGANGDRYEGWLSKPVPIIDGLLPNDIKGQLGAKGYPAEPINRQAASTSPDPLGDSRGFYIRGQAVGQSQAVHTATDIPISAFSSGSTAYQQFSAVQDNTDVFFKLARAALGGY